MINECPGPLAPDQAMRLQAGGAPQGRMLYPYEATVWPRGLLSPVLQWEHPGTVDAIYLRLQSREFLYEGCFAGTSSPFRLLIPQNAWNGAGEWSRGVGDPLTMTLSTLSGGNVITLTQTYTFALATIKGAIYYNTYTSPLAMGNGAVMKIVPGQAQPAGFLTVMGVPPFGPCVSCHSLSANGSVMTANEHNYTPLWPNPYVSRSYDLSSGNAAVMNGGLPEAGFAGIFPDGSRMMTNGPPSASNASGFFPAGAGNLPALIGPAESHLLDARSGARLPAPGWDGEVLHAQMPMFSPDGRMIAYNDADQGGGHSLWIADFDPATNTFSNRREVFRDATLYPGWPFFTPDSRAVIFQLGTRSDFVSQIPDLALPTIAPHQMEGRGHLRLLYVDTPGQSITLDATNGYIGGQSYLPAGEARDNNLEFFPTVSPVAAGGYFWVFFTSRRTYGNTWTPTSFEPTSKKIWVAAVDIGRNPGVDPSHPAFLLPGQEIESGNVRAFAALEPCKEDGQQCTSGTECCGGFCVDGICQPPQMCANLDDRCTTKADCCDQTLECIGGYCAEIIIIQ
jgi:hypothetical protein